MKTDDPKPEPTLNIAEVRLSIERSSVTHTLTVRGRKRPEYHFFREKETGFYRRRYVRGGGLAERGVFPLSAARGDIEDLQRSATRRGGFAIHMKLLTLEEVEAETEAAAERLRMEEAQTEENRRQLAQAEQERKTSEQRKQSVADGTAAPEGALPKPAATPKAKKTGAKPSALSKLEQTVGAGA